MPQRPGENSRSKVAGRYQAVKPLVEAAARGQHWKIPRMPARVCCWAVF